MTDALVSWLLGIPYLLTGIGFLFLAWAAGGYAYTLLCSNRLTSAPPWFLSTPGAGVFLLVVRTAAGMAVLSWGGTVAGVTGLFRPDIVFGLLLLPVIILGLLIASRFGLRNKPTLLRDRMDWGHDWYSSALTEKAFGGAVIFGFCAVVVNALIGALVPDMNQDPMWYHLSVPQQWVFDQRFEMYPDVMPSAYPLAVEALYALIFLLNPDPVLCSLLTAMSGTMLFVAMAATASMAVSMARPGASRGWGMGAVVGVWVPMLLVYGMLAPVQPKNDIIVTLWMFTGVMTLWLPMLSSRCAPSAGWWIVGGFLLGTACSAKPSVLPMTFFTMAFVIPLSSYYEKRSHDAWPKQTVIGGFICLIFMVLAAAPWMYRGFSSHGLPLFPLGQSLFPVAVDYAPLLRTFNSLHGFVEPTWTGWFETLFAFPARLGSAAGTGEKSIFLYILLAVTGVFLRRSPRWRWFSCMLLVQLLLLAGMKGAGVFRFFVPAYYLAVPLLAWVIADSAPRLSRPVRLILGFTIWAVMLTTVALHQYRLAAFNTMNWQFKPVLSKDDRRGYATHAETGSLALSFALVKDFIEEDERVLLLGSTYPFYLHRNTLWNDEAIRTGGLADRWKSMNPDEAKRFLWDEAIDVVLYAGGGDKLGPDASPVLGLLEAKTIASVPLPPELSDAGWRLFRVIRN